MITSIDEHLERDAEVVSRKPQEDEDRINSILRGDDPVMEIIRGWGKCFLKEWIETREEKRLIAVRIYCEIFEEDIWLTFDESFIPDDELTFYAPYQILFQKGFSHKKVREHYIIMSKFQDEMRKILQST